MMIQKELVNERARFQEYLNERPSAQDGQGWLETLDLQRVEASEYSLEIATGPGQEFLYHPLLRGGFLDDVYECFEDQSRAEEFMRKLSEDVEGFRPLTARRCVLSGWKKS
jgi:hypothetical protein